MVSLNPCFLNGGLRADKDVIDGSRWAAFASPWVMSAAIFFSLMEGKVAIGEAGGGEFQNRRVRFSGVEVTHEDDLGFRMFFDPLENEVGGFDPRFLTAVIPVGVEEDKFLA